MEVVCEINKEVGRFDPKNKSMMKYEIPNHMFTSYLYESVGLKLLLTSEEIDRVFWNAAAPGVPTQGIKEFLEFLDQMQIRTGVISNIPYCGKVVEERINNLIPTNHFEFIIASSEYMFRKPNKRIFDLALEKAGLTPDEVWFIGDQYDCDIVGENNAGMYPIWYLAAIDMELPKEMDETVLRIHDWKELQTFLKKIK